MKDFLELARRRYSVRRYQSAPVEQEKLDKILEAAELAPTACNNQPQKIYVVTSEDKRNALAAVCPCTFDAPVVFVVCYDENRAAGGKIVPDYDFGDIDSAIVCTHMTLAAADLGLGSCIVGWFRESDVQNALGLPKNIRVRELLPVGYAAPGDRPSGLHAKSRSREDMAEYL